MDENNKISILEFCSLFLILGITSFLGIGVYNAVKSGGLDSYLSIIPSFLLGILLLLIFFKIWDYEPDLNILEKNKKLFGKFFGNILNLIFLFLIITSAMSGLYNCLSFINSQMLPETPIWFLGIAFTIISAFANYKGIETISRASVIIVALNTILFFTAVFSLIFNIDFNNFLPIFNNGLIPIFKGSVYIIFQQIIPLFVLLIIPKNKVINCQKSRKYIFITYTFTIFLIFLLLICTIGNLGIELTKFYAYPEYMVLKKIELFNFIDRIENVLTIQWIFGYVMSYTLIIYYLSQYIKKENKNKIIITLISFTTTFLTCFYFKGESKYAIYVYKEAPILKIITIFLLIFIWFTIICKKKLKHIYKIR